MVDVAIKRSKKKVPKTNRRFRLGDRRQEWKQGGPVVGPGGFKTRRRNPLWDRRLYAKV